jgi:phosphate transport system substrate-binding protein
MKRLFALGFLGLCLSACNAGGDAGTKGTGSSGVANAVAPGGDAGTKGTGSSGLVANKGTIAIDGSSTVFPLSEAVAEEFGKQPGAARVTVGVSGTGGGFSKFCAGETDLSDASRPISAKEIEKCKEKGVEYIEIPVAYDGVVIAVNPQNTWAQQVTVEDLKKLWAPEAQNTVKKWKEVRAEWPDAEIHLFGAGVDSGTYDYFTEAVVGKAKSSRGDYTSSEDDNVLVTGVSGDVNALGFFGYSYLQANPDKLRALPVDDGKAENGAGPIAPTLETIANGSYAPLSRPVFVYVSKAALARPEVASFVDFFLKEGPALAKEVGLIPLPETAQGLIQKRYEARTVGTVFTPGAPMTGLTLEKLLSAEAGN